MHCRDEMKCWDFIFSCAIRLDIIVRSYRLKDLKIHHSYRNLLLCDMQSHIVGSSTMQGYDATKIAQGDTVLVVYDFCACVPNFTHALFAYLVHADTSATAFV